MYLCIIKVVSLNSNVMNYYVNKNAQSTGEHEVHNSLCRFLPEAANRIYLGSFLNCAEAVKKAKEYYTKVDGCYFCCPNCHKR